MSKIRKKAEQIATMWEKTGMTEESLEFRIDVLEEALKMTAADVLDWCSKVIKKYETQWDEGQAARKFMEQATTFKETL